MKYSDGLTLVNATNGTAFSELSLTTPGQFKSPCKFLWDSISGQTSSNGTILTLTFEVTDTSISSYDIEISCNDGDVYDENLDTVYMKTQNGTISIPADQFNFAETVTVKEMGGVKYVYGFKTGMTETQFKNGGYTEYEDVTVTVEKSSARYLGTGSKIIVEYASGETEEYVIVIFGDLDGSAKVDANDASILAESLVGTSVPVEGAYKLAANVYGTGSRITVNDQDLAALNTVASGEMSIDQTTGHVVEAE